VSLANKSEKTICPLVGSLLPLDHNQVSPIHFGNLNFLLLHAFPKNISVHNPRCTHALT